LVNDRLMVVQEEAREGAAEGHLIDGAGKLLAHGTTTCLIVEL
jgi:hypothetical protein